MAALPQAVAPAMDRVDIADAHARKRSRRFASSSRSRSRRSRRSRAKAHATSSIVSDRAGACRALRRADAAHDRLRSRARPADRHARASHACRGITRPLGRRAAARSRLDVRNGSAGLYQLAAARDRRRRVDAGAGRPAAEAASHRQRRGRRRVVGRPCDARRDRRQQHRRDGRLGSDAVARSRRATRKSSSIRRSTIGSTIYARRASCGEARPTRSQLRPASNRCTEMWRRRKRFLGGVRTYDALAIVPTPVPSPNGGGRFADGDPAIAFSNPLDSGLGRKCGERSRRRRRR